ncbi:peroxidase domain-containing protein [Phthorimaea operculella]|nr:peroxidase domain-containing protein [Phthorimaea operculella]
MAKSNNSANIIIGANILVVWIYRAHNTIARELEKMNPCWDDDRIYFETKEIVIAYINHMWYYEMFAQLIGYEYLLNNGVIFDTWGHVNDYDPSKEPRVTIEYVIGTRWFHTVQEGRLKTYDSKGKLLDELLSVEMTLRTGILFVNKTLEGLTQGLFRQPCAEADHLLDPDMGERVLGGFQFASDISSSDIMKGREAGLAPYNKYRQICHLPVAKEWEDLEHWIPEEQLDALRLNYETVDDVDIMAGILAEKPMMGAAFGPTLACIITDQLRWWRQSDRFWYENSQHPGAFTPEQLYEIRKMRMSRMICDYGDEVEEVQPWAFLVPGPGNELLNCKKHPPGPSLAPWKDDSCNLKITPPGSVKKDKNWIDTWSWLYKF